MAVTKKMIIIEDRLQELFNYLPEMGDIKDSGNTYSPIFKYGDQKELIAFLKLNAKVSVYPLIWLVYPYNEEHHNNRVYIENMSLILAVEGNNESLNEERIKLTFNKILIPLFDNIKELFQLGNIINIGDTYRVTKYPNYSHAEDGELNQVTAIWDAMKITFNCDISNRCLKPITLI